MVVQQPFAEDTTFLFHVEHLSSACYWVFTHPSDDIVASKFGPTALFWETSLGHAISEYGATILPYVNPPQEPIFAAEEDILWDIHQTLTHLRRMGDNLRQRSLSPFLIHLRSTGLE